LSLEIHPSTVQNIYLRVLSEHPTTGPQVLSAQTVEVAMPAVGVSPSTWVTVSWATGTSRVGDDRYYVAVVPTASFTFSANTTYQPWIRIGGASGAYLKISDTIRAINT
jgi:hypothetical protein